MKAEQSSIYRSIERLHLWALETFDNAPNKPAVQADIRLVMENIMQAQTATAIALNLPDGRQKLDLLDVVVMSMTNVKSITKVLSEFSDKPNKKDDTSNGETVLSPSRTRVISRKQRVPLIELMTDISNQLGRWKSKVAKICATSEP